MNNNRFNNEDLYSAIRSCVLFSGLEERDLNDIINIAQPATLESGQTLFSEGDPANAFYIIVSGKMRVFKLSPAGREQTLMTASRSASIAEAALFAGGTYPAYAQANTDVELARIDKEEFLNLILSRPQLAVNMIALLSERLKIFARKIEQLSLMGVVPRLAEYIIQNSEKDQTVKLNITKGELASLLGTVPETLSRAFAKLKAGGYISESGSFVQIQSLDGLKDVASSHE